MLRFLTGAAILALTVAAPISALQPGTAPIKIGLLVPLTGPYASLGEDCRMGTELALNAVDKDLLQTVVQDSASDPKTAIAGYRQMREKSGISGVIAIRSPVGVTLNPLVQADKVPIIGVVGADRFPAENPWAFQSWSGAGEEGAFLAAALHSRGIRRVAQIYTADEWTSDVSRGFREAFLAGGGEIPIDEAVDPKEQEFSSLFLRVREARVQAVFANLGIGQYVNFAKRRLEQRITSPLYVNYFFSKQEVAGALPAAAVEGVSFVEFTLGLPKFEAAFHRVNPGHSISGATFGCYAAGKLVSEAVERARPHDGPELFAAMASAEVVTAPDGELAIRERRVKFPLAIKTLRNGKVVE